MGREREEGFYSKRRGKKYVDDKTRYGEKLMLDKEPKISDIEKIFSMAMIEEVS